MMLVLGACASGKRTYVRSLGYADADMADGILDARPVVCNVQDLVTSQMDCAASADADSFDAVALTDRLTSKAVVVCNEVGSGVVPVDEREREVREQVGRLCVLLADRADRVVRLVCGIPQVLKG